jgi:hypothetical protein
MDQFDRNLRQWVNEEQFGRRLTRRPMRPYGASGALGLALAALLMAMMGTCGSEPGSVGGPTPSPQATVHASTTPVDP